MTRPKLNKQSADLAEAHDMLVKTLSGQSYKKESFHKVSTTQVTGEALKKVSVGGKGGFGSQGDARDQKKEVQATTRVMVLSKPSQEAFDANALIDEKVIGFDENWRPIFGVPKGRDYDEFDHSNDLDPSDFMRISELHLSGEDLERTRNGYDELCGYKDAHKYIGLNGYEHRRYRIIIVNDLNEPPEHTHTAYVVDGKIVVKEGYKKPSDDTSLWAEEASHRHHNDIFKALNQFYYVHGEDEEWLKDWMMSNRKDHAAYVIWRLSQDKYAPEQTRIAPEPVRIKSEEFLEMKEAADELERTRRFKAFEKAPNLEDLKIVYKWELTKQGKTMFSNEKI